jgi:GNAT superfamily N-acetyltransferase
MPGLTAFWRKLVALFARRHGPEMERGALPDGTPVLMRPLIPGDAPLVAEALAQLSEKSRYQRFLAPVERLTPAQLEYLTHVDGSDHIAIGMALAPARRGEPPQPIAIARSIRDPQQPEEAEVAIVVADEWQRRGAGSLLLAMLAERAWTTGIRRWRAVVLATNRPARALLERVGTCMEERSDGPTAELTYELHPPGLEAGACSRTRRGNADRLPRPAPRPNGS